MNQLQLLMFLLTRRRISDREGSEIIFGSSERELQKKLGLIKDLSKMQLYELLEALSLQISPLGLEIKQNPLNQYWFIKPNSNIQSFLDENPFNNRPRLAATLMVIIALFLQNNGVISKKLIEKYRKVSDLNAQLIELDDMNFIILNKNKITIHPYLGYFLDFNEVLTKMKEDTQQTFSEFNELNERMK